LASNKEFNENDDDDAGNIDHSTLPNIRFLLDLERSPPKEAPRGIPCSLNTCICGTKFNQVGLTDVIDDIVARQYRLATEQGTMGRACVEFSTLRFGID
jgi:hypothetical protein